MPVDVYLRFARSLSSFWSTRERCQSHLETPRADESLETLIGELTGLFGTVIETTEGAVALGVLDKHRLAALNLLRRFASERGADLVSHWEPWVGHARIRRVLGAQHLPAHELRIAGLNLELDFWRDHGNAFVCPRDGLTTKRIPKIGSCAQAFTPGHRLELASLHGKPIDTIPRFDVDVVYTWVDDKDPAWRQQFASYASQAEGGSARKALFRSTEELRYSLRSLTYAPWIRQVFLVTNCAPPPWLELSNPRLRIVPHESILPAETCPTFNSHAIEASLHKIAGLAEHFLYLNDDMFFLNRVDKSDFFLSNGVSKSFLEPYGMVTEVLGDDAPDFIFAARNGKRLIEELFDLSPTHLHEHVPYSLRCSVLGEIEQKFALEFERTRRSRFRSPSDISVPSFLYHHYAYHTRQAVRASISSQYVIKTRDWRARLERLRHSPFEKVFCINDSESMHVDAAQWGAQITEVLRGLYPYPSEFERV